MLTGLTALSSITNRLQALAIGAYRFVITFTGKALRKLVPRNAGFAGLVLCSIAPHAVIVSSSVTFTPSEARAERSYLDGYTLGLKQLDSLEKAVLYLHFRDVPNTRIADMLGVSDDKVLRARRRAIGIAIVHLERALQISISGGIESLDAAELAVGQKFANDMWDGLSPVKTTDGVDLTTLIEDPSKGVKLFGLTKNAEEVAPLAVVVPAGVLPEGTPLSLAVPVVLSPTAEGVQRMVVADARHLYTRADGGSVYVLKSFCLDHDAKAPTFDNTSFRFSKEAQAALTPRIREALKAGRDDIIQNRIWHP